MTSSSSTHERRDDDPSRSPRNSNSPKPKKKLAVQAAKPIADLFEKMGEKVGAGIDKFGAGIDKAASDIHKAVIPNKRNKGLLRTKTKGSKRVGLYDRYNTGTGGNSEGDDDEEVDTTLISDDSTGTPYSEAAKNIQFKAHDFHAPHTDTNYQEQGENSTKKNNYQNDNNFYKYYHMGRLIYKTQWCRIHVCRSYLTKKERVVKIVRETCNDCHEFDILKNTDHPNMPTMYELFQGKKNEFFIVMNYCQGGTLLELLKGTTRGFGPPRILLEQGGRLVGDLMQGGVKMGAERLKDGITTMATEGPPRPIQPCPKELPPMSNSNHDISSTRATTQSIGLTPHLQQPIAATKRDNEWDVTRPSPGANRVETSVRRTQDDSSHNQNKTKRSSPSTSPTRNGRSPTRKERSPGASPHQSPSRQRHHRSPGRDHHHHQSPTRRRHHHNRSPPQSPTRHRTTSPNRGSPGHSPNNKRGSPRHSPRQSPTRRPSLTDTVTVTTGTNHRRMDDSSKNRRRRGQQQDDYDEDEEEEHQAEDPHEHIRRKFGRDRNNNPQQQQANNKSPLSEEDAKLIMLQLLACLRYCHDSGIVHCDVKPGNIMLTYPKDISCITLIDFDTSFQQQSPDDSMNYQRASGTGQDAAYLAPEVVQEFPCYNHKSDIWSAGVTLYKMLSNTLPFVDGPQDTEEHIRRKILSGRPIAFPDEQWAGISRDAKEYIAYLLNRRPADRPCARQAVMHTWLAGAREQMARIFDPERAYEPGGAAQVLHNLRKFNAADTKMKEAVCAFIASHLLTTDEHRTIDRVFQALDTQRDGKIRRFELKHAYYKVYNAFITEKELDKMMKRIDLDGNNEIAYSEFSMAAVDKKDLLSRPRLKNAFDLFDKQGKGYVTHDEIRDIFRFVEMDMNYLTKIIMQVDTNNDGKISFNEFVTMMTNSELHNI